MSRNFKYLYTYIMRLMLVEFDNGEPSVQAAVVPS